MENVIEIVTSHRDAAQSDRAYWHAQTADARIKHTLELRRINYGIDDSSGRLKRVLEITTRSATKHD